MRDRGNVMEKLDPDFRLIRANRENSSFHLSAKFRLFVSSFFFFLILRRSPKRLRESKYRFHGVRNDTRIA